MSRPPVPAEELMAAAKRVLSSLGRDMAEFADRIRQTFDRPWLREAAAVFAIEQYAARVRAELAAELATSIERQRHDMGLPEHEFVAGGVDWPLCVRPVLGDTERCGWPEHRHYPREQ